jgi:hypothetical protein
MSVGLLMAVGTAAASANNLQRALSGRTVVRPLQGVSASSLRSQSAAGTTVPIWTGTISALGTAYSYAMVGKNPMVHQAAPTTNVGTDIVPMRLKFADTGHVFDPTATPAAGCPAKTPLALAQGSPVFGTHQYTIGGTNVGNVQYTDGFQRMNFAKFILNTGAVNPGYHVTLTQTTRPVYTVNVPLADGSSSNTGGTCGWLGQMDINWFDNVVNKSILPFLRTNNRTTTARLPILLTSNVVMYDTVPTNCCILGYHSATAVGTGTQTYSVSEYDTSKAFAPTLTDATVLSHEVGEWLDDPFGNNATPSWGNIGQVTGCQANLEVGDPLSDGHNVVVKMPNGVTYHPQELAFFSWFYHQKPSIGLHGWYSSNGTFKTSAALC